MKKISLILSILVITCSCSKNSKVTSPNDEDFDISKNARQIDHGGVPPLGGCLVIPVNDTLRGHGDTINSQLLYSFRDNVLGYATLSGGLISDRTGYINYYARLSTFVTQYGILNTSTFSDCVQLLQYAEVVSNRALFGSNSDIVVTDDIYYFCKAQESKVTSNSHYSEVSDIITDIDADLEALRGKSKSYFVTYFQ